MKWWMRLMNWVGLRNYKYTRYEFSEINGKFIKIKIFACNKTGRVYTCCDDIAQTKIERLQELTFTNATKRFEKEIVYLEDRRKVN